MDPLSNLSDSLPADLAEFDFLQYLWVPYTLFILVVLAVSVALFYHWSVYAHIRHLRFRLVEAIYVVGVAVLLLISVSFFILI